MDAYQLWTVASLVTSDLRSRINTVKNSFYESSSSVRIVWNTEGNSAERGREREGGKVEEVRRGRRDFVGFSARAKLNPRATTEIVRSRRSQRNGRKTEPSNAIGIELDHGLRSLCARITRYEECKLPGRERERLAALTYVTYHHGL